MLAQRPVEPETDIAFLASRLRQADQDEARAALGVNPSAALALSVRASQVCEVVVECPSLDPVMLYGAGEVAPGAAMVWACGTDRLSTVGREFLRHSRLAVGLLNARWPLLFNYVDVRNAAHVRWLKWCGFTFIKLHPQFGAERRPFWEFVRIQACVR